MHFALTSTSSDLLKIGNMLDTSTIQSPKLTEIITSGVARGVAGVAEATPIIQFLFNKFGQKIRVKKIIFTAGYTNFKILPTSLLINTFQVTWQHYLYFLEKHVIEKYVLTTYYKGQFHVGIIILV